MRRLLAGTVVTLALVTAAVFGVGAGGVPHGSYTVRAIFDDAASAVPGEDVRIAGAKVGSIGHMDVTPRQKAAIELHITDGGFKPFHADATCTIRPQSLIGEKFVECTPGTPNRPALKRIPDGQKGAGQYLLPLRQTSSPVDIDLINNVLRLPYRQRFAIVLNELGAGFAGRGQDLNALIRRADPALRETDKLLQQLAGENETLRDLARDSDAALSPLARDRRHLSGFIRHANTVGEATAARRADIERSIQKLPGFLRQLKPTMQDLGSLAGQTTPVLSDLQRSAPSLSRFTRQLGPLSRSATRSLVTLGSAAQVGGPVLQRARPVVRDLKDFGAHAKPVATTLDDLTASLDRTGGLERAMDYIFFQMTAVNGFDSIGHYLRAGLLVNTCSTYATSPAAGCSANFTQTKAIQAGASGASDARLVRTAAALEKATRKQGAPVVQAPKRQTPVQTVAQVVRGLLNLGAVQQLETDTTQRLRQIRDRANSDSSPALQNVGGDAQQQALLRYLMGNDG
jgi:phospholipid/cholesterol/gamma-HCH transport system substrate-binding protein